MDRDQDERDGGMGRDVLVVPFIFVPQGHPPPWRWMAEHPDYIRVPATFAPRGAAPPRGPGAPWSGARPEAATAPVRPVGTLPAGFVAEAPARAPAADGAPVVVAATMGVQRASNGGLAEPRDWTEPQRWLKDTSIPSEAEEARRGELTRQIDAYIDRYLAKSAPDSPLHGKGWAFVEYGARFGVDPRFLLGIAIAETGLGTHITRGTNNIFNVIGERKNIDFESIESSIYSASHSIEDPKNRYFGKGKYSTLAIYKNNYCNGPSCADGLRTIDRTLNDLGGSPNDVRYKPAKSLTR